MSRRRQRSRTTLTGEDEEPVVNIEESESAHDQESDDSDEDETTIEAQKKELEVWEAFKEEHHEVLEQLPLSLHRQFKLMGELDSQGQVLHADLFASVRQYIRLRESLAARQSNGDLSMQADASHTINGDPHPSTNAISHQPMPGQMTRTLLQHIAQTSEETIRTAEEKVSIAQTAYETVDRHIRLLDQAIKEQEAAISLGARPGTHLAPILLPDLVVPRWARPPRVEHSPVPSLSPEPELYIEEPPMIEPHPPANPSPKAPKKGKKAAAPKPTKPEKEESHPPAVVDLEEPPTAPRTRRATVRLTIPAQPQPPGPAVPVDPNEARYCYCNQVSFGTMIGCDGVGCKLEWFHLECTGLLEVPNKKTNWYCRECKSKLTQKGRSKT